MSSPIQSMAQWWARVYEDETLRRYVLVNSLAIGLATTLAYCYYYWWCRHPLYGQNRGPRVYPIVGSIFGYLRNRHRMMDFHAEMLSKLPTRTSRAVRPGGRTIFVTANPSNVEYMLKTNFQNYPKGEFINANLRDLLGDGIFNADDHMWKIQRKVASQEFTTRSLRDFALESVERETYDRLLPVLSQASQSGRILDLQDVFARFSFDNICRLGFGVDPACLDITVPDVKFAAAFDRATLLSLKRTQSFPRTIWKIKRALDIGEEKELRLAVNAIDEFAMGVIKNRRQEIALASSTGETGVLEGKSDLLSRFMTLVDNEGEEGIRAGSSDPERKWTKDRRSSCSNNFCDTFLRDMVISFVLAGRDTSTAALSWFFWLLSVHPRAEKAILEEISRALSSRPPPLDGDGSDEHNNNRKNHSGFSFEELKNMHYLHAALTEAMRLYPPVPADFKTVRKADVWPDGTVINANSIVGYHPYAMGRMEDLWGEDCLEFRPERWLNDGLFVPQSPFKYTVFQAGPRTCLGKDMVMLQMKLVCVVILSNFELTVPEDYKADYLITLTMRMKDGLPVTLRNRRITYPRAEDYNA